MKSMRLLIIISSALFSLGFFLAAHASDYSAPGLNWIGGTTYWIGIQPSQNSTTITLTPIPDANEEIATMHKSQLAGFIIDCQTDDLDQAAAFWSAALGLPAEADPDPEESDYRYLETRPEDLHIEVQKVDHPSRVHLDIETDDIEAEVARLEALGARRIANARRWVVMEAPTGQRFCVVNPQRANFDQMANKWD